MTSEFTEVCVQSSMCPSKILTNHNKKLDAWAELSYYHKPITEIFGQA